MNDVDAPAQVTLIAGLIILLYVTISDIIRKRK